MEQILIGRRSVYNPDLTVGGYEVVMQSDQGLQLCCIADKSSLDYLPNIECVLDSQLVLLPYHSDLLIHSLPEYYPTQHLVVTFSKKSMPERRLRQTAMELIEMGYGLALADLGELEDLRDLLDVSYLVKLDARNISPKQMKKQSEILRHYDVKLMAENLETYDHLRYCKEIQLDLFHGNFLSKPDYVSNKTVSVNRVAIMELLTKLQSPDVTCDEIERALSGDPRLSFRLLKIVNSAAYALSREVESLKEAVIYLGLQQIRSWASLIAMSNVDDKPQELMLVTMVRAKMCELLAEQLRYENANGYFTVGLLSTLDALLDDRMSTVLEDLPLSENLKQALLYHDGQVGDVLQNVIAYEQADWQSLNLHGLAPEHYRDAYLESLAWASDSKNSLMS